jgi:hypothetical protein
MIGCDFYDGQPPTGELPQWATITQVSDFLEIPRNAIRSAVRRAVANNEEWVKKETGEGGSTHYLIDTTHEIYQYHQERWKQNKARATSFGEADAAWSHAGHSRFSSTMLEEDPFSRYETVPHSGQQDSEVVLQRWPHFRQWLYAEGIQVFQNLLAEDGQRTWEWRWGELHGEGYESVEEAIIMVLQNGFDAKEVERYRKEEEHIASFHMQEQPPAKKPFWSRGNG